ncbi:hypothetical protein PYW08_007386 [Mythimna loreyi]|uniref:Uncharacterized protein n=1 Tax=Mythimna loreyi TaxID=667449 RepID=A0ACC2QBF7_9NEOP|nr:hypothetical protein PYW08_007386 [Mythimna loreyi]
MLGIRTPSKKLDSEKSPPKPRASPPTSVRRSVGEWEAVKITCKNPTLPPTTKTVQAGPSNIIRKSLELQENKTLSTHSRVTEDRTPPKLQYADRSTEARACLNKAKLHLSSSRNTKTEIKNGITEALDRLYQLVKEAEKEAKAKTSSGEKQRVELETAATVDATFSINAGQSLLVARIEEHSKLLQENSKKMEELKATMEQKIATTYASRGNSDLRYNQRE